jgi:lipopolysaccharide export system protein LptC
MAFDDADGLRRLQAPPGAGYTRFVALMKLLLPAVAVGLVMLVAAWPKIEASLDRLKVALPRLDLSEARDLRMVNARFSGVDKQNRPFTVIAETARQNPSKDDIVALEGPKADITLQSGAWVAVTSDTGVYQQQSQVLDLFGSVHLFHDRGVEFVTDTARVFMNESRAEGDDPIAGQGAFGELSAEGFRILDKGDRVVFTGKARLLLVPHAAGDGT